MQAKPVHWVITVTVFYVAAYGVSHFCCVYPYLVLPSCLKPELHQSVLCGALQNVEVSNGVLAAVILR